MTTHTAPEHDTRDISPEDVLGDDPLQILTHAKGPSGTVPFTEDFLTNGASGDHFGMTQNAGMGWNPVELLRKQFVILSTAGGLRQPDGTPIALGLHTGHFELSTMVEAAARELRDQKAIPFALFCSDPCDECTQGTTGMLDSLPYRNDAAQVFRRQARSLPTARGVMGVASCDKGPRASSRSTTSWSARPSYRRPSTWTSGT